MASSGQRRRYGRRRQHSPAAPGSEAPDDAARDRAGARDRADLLGRTVTAGRGVAGVLHSASIVLGSIGSIGPRLRDRDLRAPLCRRRRDLRVPLASRPQLVRDLLGRGVPARYVVPRRRRDLHRPWFPGPGLLPEPPAHFDPLVGRWRRRARDRVHPQSPRRPARDPGRPPPGLDLGDPVAVPVGRDHRQGRRRRQHARRVQPE